MRSNATRTLVTPSPITTNLHTVPSASMHRVTDASAARPIPGEVTYPEAYLDTEVGQGYATQRQCPTLHRTAVVGGVRLYWACVVDSLSDGTVIRTHYTTPYYQSPESASRDVARWALTAPDRRTLQQPDEV